MSLATKFVMAIAPAVLLALAGCTTGFPAQVSRFNALPAPQGQSFTIQATDPQNRGGLEFAQYAALVRQRLIEQGFAEAPSAARADLVVELDYGVDNGQTRVVSHGSEFGLGYRRFGYFSPRSYYWGWHDPFLFDDYPSVSSYTLYTSFVDLDIKRTADGQAVFEGTAKARSRTDELPRLVPNLVEALFTNFPGKSGEMVKITVPPPARPAS